MTIPTIIYNEGGGSGGEVLDEYLDTLVSVTKAVTTYPLGPTGFTDAPTDTYYTGVVEAAAPTVSKDTHANQGAAALATLEGWWHAPTYSGSGDLVNSGTGGSGMNMVLGAAGAAPTFTTDHFTFDGVDDYMRFVDADQFEVGPSESVTLGIICTPLTALTNGATFMSKLSAESSGFSGYHLRINTSALYMYGEAGGLGLASPVTITDAISVKALHAGVLNRGIYQPAVNLVTAHRSAAGVLTSTAGTAMNTTTHQATLANAFNFVIGARAALSNFMKMDMYGAFLTKKPLMPATLAAIAAYYGV